MEHKTFGIVVVRSKLLLDGMFPHLYNCVTGKIQHLTIFGVKRSHFKTLTSLLETMILTLLFCCNQPCCKYEVQPGVAPLKLAIDGSFQATSVERKSANQAYLPTFARNWFRAVKFLIELLFIRQNITRETRKL